MASKRVSLAILVIEAACAYAVALMGRAETQDRDAVEKVFNEVRRKSYADVQYAMKAARNRRNSEQTKAGEDTAD